MKKRVLSLLMCGIMVVSMLPVSALALELPELDVLEATVEAVEEEGVALEEQSDALPKKESSQEENPKLAIEIESVETDVLEAPAVETAEDEDSQDSDEVLWRTIRDAFVAEDPRDIPEAVTKHPFLSGIATLDVGDNSFWENEPNDSMSYADRVYDDYTVTGSVSGYDLDYYGFTLMSESEVTIISVADRRSLVFGIWDSDDEIVAAGSDNGMTSGGSYGDVLSCTLSAGTYYIVFFDNEGYSNGYTFYIEIASTGTGGAGGSEDTFIEVEPNNSRSTANRIYNNYTVSGTISSSDRVDYFKVVITEESEVTIVSVANRRNFMIGIMDSSGEAVAAGVDMGLSDSGDYYRDALYCTVPAGTYYIAPLDTDGGYNSYAFYIEITPTDKDGVVINSDNFPDDNFRGYVKDEIDADSNGVLSSSEIEAVTGIYCYDMGISSFEGIEYFTELIELDCGFNNLTSLNLSENTKLEYLACGSNQLKTLDLSNNTKLTEVYCWGNQLRSLNLGENTKLELLDCGTNNLIELNVSQLTGLVRLYCEGNKLQNLDISQNANLKGLVVYGNNLYALDLSNNTQLLFVYCDDNNLSELNLSNNVNLEALSVENNPLVELDITNCPNLIVAVEDGDKSEEDGVVSYDYWWEGDPDEWEDDLYYFLSCDASDVICVSTDEDVGFDIYDDGTTDTLDLIYLMKYIVGSVTEINKDAADMNNDGNIDILDVICLVRYLAG